MAENVDIPTRLKRCRAILEPMGQDHLLRWWDELDDAQRELLIGDVEAVPWSTVQPLIESHGRTAPRREVPSNLEPAKVYPAHPKPDRENLYTEANQRGEGLLAGGRVAAFTVAGGQGTRLGFSGPKGAVAVTPVGDRTLFELFGAMVIAARRKYGSAIPWYVMTSPANHDETVAFFERFDFFGLPPADVRLFPQGMLPAFDLTGRVLLSQKHRVALAPDGHGGSLKALVSGGAIADMQRRGVSVITYFQVDNPLVKPFDPLFIGLHATTGSEMSTKVTPKADDLERVGNVCRSGDRVIMIEYSELPETLARRRDVSGRRLFDAANLAVHLLDVAFVERIAGSSFQLPIRRAEKIVPYVDDSGASQEPDAPNAVKLETFVFDALPLAKNPLVFEVNRDEEFSPVKNATGVDSLETSRRDQVARAFRWLETAGVHVPRRDNGDPNATVAIDPSLALDAEDVEEALRSRAKEGRPLPKIHAGDALYLE